MNTGGVKAKASFFAYYAFSKSADEYIPKYGGYTTTEFPEIRSLDDILWISITYTVNDKPTMYQTIVGSADLQVFRIETTEIHETEEPL